MRGMTENPSCISTRDCAGRSCTLNQSKRTGNKLSLEFECIAYEMQSGYVIRDCEVVELF